MCFDVFMYLRDFSRFFPFFVFKQIMQILFRYMLCYNVIILIQILIRYNVKNLITACTRSLDFDLNIEKSPYPSQTLPPLGRFAPSHLSLFHSVPPQCVDPRYATGFTYMFVCFGTNCMSVIVGLCTYRFQCFPIQIPDI